MSGIELLIIPASIAAFVSAVNDGRKLLATYKEKRLRKRQARQAASFDQSLIAFSTAVQDSLNSYTTQFGNGFQKDRMFAPRRSAVDFFAANLLAHLHFPHFLSSSFKLSRIKHPRISMTDCSLIRASHS